MGFIRSLKSNLLSGVGRFGKGAERVANTYAPMLSKGIRKGVKLVDQYAPVAQRLVGHIGTGAASAAGLAGSISSGNIPGAIASGRQLAKSVKGAVKEVKSVMPRNRKKEKAQIMKGLNNMREPESLSGQRGMSGDFASSLKKLAT